MLVLSWITHSLRHSIYFLPTNPYINQRSNIASQDEVGTVIIIRLLNTKSLKVKEFFASKVPCYAILPNTLGKEKVGTKCSDITGRTETWLIKLRGCCAEYCSTSFFMCWLIHVGEYIIASWFSFWRGPFSTAKTKPAILSLETVLTQRTSGTEMPIYFMLTS